MDRLLADCAQGGGHLPLLALTLARPYQDYGGQGDLTLGEYEAMGGLHRVVETGIDTLLAADPTERRAQLDTLHNAFIPWLATINPDNDQPMRRLARWSDLPVDSHALIAAVEKRLLVTDDRDGQTVAEVAMESLLRRWHELAGWLDYATKHPRHSGLGYHTPARRLHRHRRRHPHPAPNHRGPALDRTP